MGPLRQAPEFLVVGYGSGFAVMQTKTGFYAVARGSRRAVIFPTAAAAQEVADTAKELAPKFGPV